MIKLFQPYVNQQARENVLRVLSGTQLAQGPEVDLFEKEFAARFGYEAWQIVSVNSGTSALELAYHMVGIRKGDAVIAPVLTCTATNIPLIRREARIIFADVEGKTHLNIDPQDVYRKISKYTKAIVFVCFGGNCEGLAEVRRIASERHIDLIVDGAQALGGEIDRNARFAAISLQAIKSLTAGDGGILICRDPTDAARARRLRWFGYDREAKQRYGDADLLEAGYKFHMNDISAAIARGNMLEWQNILEHRQSINRAYSLHLGGRHLRDEYHGVRLIQGIWNPVVLGMKFSVAKERAAGFFEVGQHHYRNDKYTIFREGYMDVTDVPIMETIGDDYFLLPCHMGMTVEDAVKIAQVLWP